MDTNEVSETYDGNPAAVNPATQNKTQFATINNKVVRKLSTADFGVQDSSAHEYHVNAATLEAKRGQSDYSGGSRGGAVRPPSLDNFKLRVKEEQRQSSEIANGTMSQLSNLRQSKRALQTNYKVVQEVPFVESVHGVVSNYISSSKQQKSRRKILA